MASPYISQLNRSSRIDGPAARVLPPLVAGLCVLYSQRIMTWTATHETAFLLFLFAIVGCLLHVKMRRIVIITLCYGVSCLAARDIFFTMGLPASIRTGIYPALRMIALASISLLTLAAAAGESFFPGTVIARRCYFAGASLYFFGTGYINFIKLHSWQSMMMLITGAAALLAAIYARAIVESETEEALDLPGDSEDLTKLRAQEHHRRVLAKEWKDPAEKEQ